jgi:hypothetical protein
MHRYTRRPKFNSAGGERKRNTEKNMGTKYVFIPEGAISRRVVSYQFNCRSTDSEK